MLNNPKYRDKILFTVRKHQSINAYKIGFNLSSINTKVISYTSIHLARHTFATTMTLGKGVPIETVSKMLGHTNVQTTQIYARITNDKISKDMNWLSQNLGNLDF